MSEFDKAMTVAKLKGAAGRLRLRNAERSPLLGVRSRIDAGLMVRKRGSAWLFIRWFRRVRSALLDFCNWLLESIDNLGLGRDGSLRPDLPHL